MSADQRRALAAGPGPVRVLAGAGTGKTAVIVERFFRLLEAGLAPARILVMTFTERAAAEMRSRIEARLPGDVELAVGTFHALAQRWLRQEAVAAGVPAAFHLLSGADRWILAWDLMWRLGDPALCDVEHPEHQVGPLLRLLERMKQELIPLRRVEAAVAGLDQGDRRDLLLAALRLFRAYERECRHLGVLDFDDLLARAVGMLESRPAVLERFRARYPSILVDEYQDTNLAQERIVELIAGPRGEVFVVGDDDQSIYRFRGASRASLERFSSTFPAAQTISLEANRRSTPKIVAAAAAVVMANPDRLPKELRAVRHGGRRVELWACPDAGAEAAAIASEIHRLARAGMPLQEIAILTRTNAIAAPLARALEASGLPCRTAEWWGLLDRPASKDLLAALRLVRAADDAVAAERLASGFGALRPAAWATVRDELARAAADTGIGDLFFELMERSRYLETQTESAAAADALHFADLVQAFNDSAPDQSLSAFLAYVDLIELSGLEVDVRAATGTQVEPEPRVSVMTIHQAKGLEFEAVFVPALVEGRLPQPPRRNRLELPTTVLEPAVRGREDHLAEERRLCYVAMTRARTRLYLSWAQAYEGERRWQPSPFLADIQAGSLEAVVQRCLETPPAPPIADRTGAAPQAQARGGAVPEAAKASFSSLHAYRECPRSYWFRYVRGIPAPPSAEGHLGDAVHRALQLAGRRRSEGGSVNEADLHRFLAAAWAESPFPAPKQQRAFKRAALGMLSRYLAAGGFERAPLYVELSFEVAVDGFTLRGVIDRIDAQADGTHTVIDYKTGASLPVSRLRRDFQLALYALAAKRALGLDRLDLEIAYLREGKRVRLPATAELVDEATTIAAGAVGGIKAESFEPHPERRRCRACAYRLACDAAM